MYALPEHMHATARMRMCGLRYTSGLTSENDHCIAPAIAGSTIESLTMKNEYKSKCGNCSQPEIITTAEHIQFQVFNFNQIYRSVRGAAAAKEIFCPPLPL